jgi:sodium-dependent phosphate cotransporter
MASGYLYHLTCVIVSHCSLTAGFSTGNKDMLQTITKPFTELIVQLDKKVIEAIATGDETYAEKSLLKEWCGYSVSIVERNVTSVLNITSDDLDSA